MSPAKNVYFCHPWVHRHVLIGPFFVGVVYRAPRPTVVPHRVDVVSSLGLNGRVLARHVVMSGPTRKVEARLLHSDCQLRARPHKGRRGADARRAVHQIGRLEVLQRGVQRGESSCGTESTPPQAHGLSRRRESAGRAHASLAPPTRAVHQKSRQSALGSPCSGSHRWPTPRAARGCATHGIVPPSALEQKNGGRYAKSWRWPSSVGKTADSEVTPWRGPPRQMTT